MRTLLLSLLVVLLVPSAASAQATRTWVSAVGDDVNPCSRTAPCRTWAGAQSKTATGGEIDALDAGAFGPVNIVKPLILDGGILGSTLINASAAIAVNVPQGTAGSHVVLRNMTLHGLGTADYGVRILSADTVDLQNVRVGNFDQAGIGLEPPAGNTALLLDQVSVANNAAGLVVAAPDPAQKLNVLVRNSAISGSTGTGVAAGQGAHVWLTGTSIFGNATALAMTAGGVIDDFCDNSIAGNTDNGAAPNSLCPPLVQTNTVTNNVTNTVTSPPQVVKETVTVTQCVVPSLKGLPLSFAKRLLNAANCATGAVTKRKTRKRKLVGKVLSQGTAAGTKLPAAGRVALTVGKR